MTATQLVAVHTVYGLNSLILGGPGRRYFLKGM